MQILHWVEFLFKKQFPTIPGCLAEGSKEAGFKKIGTFIPYSWFHLGDTVETKASSQNQDEEQKCPGPGAWERRRIVLGSTLPDSVKGGCHGSSCYEKGEPTLGCSL